MLFDNDRIGYCQTLAGAFAYLFYRKKTDQKVDLQIDFQRLVTR